MFRYLRYNPLGTLRTLPRKKPDSDDPPDQTGIAISQAPPQRTGRLGTLDPLTSEIVWMDGVPETHRDLALSEIPGTVDTFLPAISDNLSVDDPR
jgi:hypothetical protein